MFQLLQSAYSTISIQDTALFLGMNEDQATNCKLLFPCLTWIGIAAAFKMVSLISLFLKLSFCSEHNIHFAAKLKYGVKNQKP